MKRILLTILFLTLPFAAFAQLKVGIMHPDDVLDALPETSQIEAELQQYIEERQRSFQAQYQEWIEELTQFSEMAESGQLSETEQQREQERLAEREQELITCKTEFKTRFSKSKTNFLIHCLTG